MLEFSTFNITTNQMMMSWRRFCITGPLLRESCAGSPHKGSHKQGHGVLFDIKKEHLLNKRSSGDNELIIAISQWHDTYLIRYKKCHHSKKNVLSGHHCRHCLGDVYRKCHVFHSKKSISIIEWPLKMDCMLVNSSAIHWCKCLIITAIASILY